MLWCLMTLCTVLFVARNCDSFLTRSSTCSLSRTFATKKMDLKPVRVRFAPSPTGSLHVGGARTALFNWLLARKTGGTFIVRVEDTDEARSTRESERSILNDLRWLDVLWDEGPEVGGPYGPYRQSERKDIYGAVADELIAQGKAYRCFSTEEELEAKKAESEKSGAEYRYDGKWRNADPQEVQRRMENGDPYSVRFKVPEGKKVILDDKVRGRVVWDTDASLGDFIILRSSKMPVYNFCVSVDDVKMKISHVIRAEEHLSNTLRQLLIFEALQYPPPVYAHCSLILGSDRSKLSKRHGATSVSQFSKQGFLPAAMVNYLAMLGWNDGTNKEIFSPAELVKAFDLERIIKAPAVFDMDKLRWVNHQHIRNLTADAIKPLLVQQLYQAPFNSSGNCTEYLLRVPANTSAEDIAGLHQARMQSPSYGAFVDVACKIAKRDMVVTTDTYRLLENCLLYTLEDTLQAEMAKTGGGPLGESWTRIVKALVARHEAGTLPKFSDPVTVGAEWKALTKDLGAELGIKGKDLFHPLRICLTGKESGPEIDVQLCLIEAARQLRSDPTAVGIWNANYPLVTLEERLARLKERFP